jgi:hypothetical protein
MLILTDHFLDTDMDTENSHGYGIWVLTCNMDMDNYNGP